MSSCRMTDDAIRYHAAQGRQIYGLSSGELKTILDGGASPETAEIPEPASPPPPRCNRLGCGRAAVPGTDTCPNHRLARAAE